MNALPPGIQTRIDDERRRLQQASELLSALACAFDNDPEACDFADAALAVRRLVNQTVTALDPTALRLAEGRPAG